VVYGIFAGKSSFAISFSFLPSWFGFILLLIMLSLLLLLEGALVCLVDLSKHSSISYAEHFPRAAYLHSQNNDEESVMSFIIGRQILVIFTVFIAAQLTGMPDLKKFPFTDSSFPDWIHSVFLAPGVLGGIVTVVFAQLTSQMLATNYPVQFLNMPGMTYVITLCKLFDWVGLVHLTWVVADVACRLFRMDDEITVTLRLYDEEIQKSKMLAIDTTGKQMRCALNAQDPDFLNADEILAKLEKIAETTAAEDSVELEDR